MINYYNPTMSGINLAKFIKLSGVSKGDVAEQKGIAPESLSRHISGRSNFSVQDAVEYGQILGVSPERLLFEPNPIKISGTTDFNIVTMFDNSESERFLNFHHFMRPSISCLITDVDQAAHQYAKFIWFFDTAYMKKSVVHQHCFAEACIVKTMDNRILCRRPYPEPQAKDKRNAASLTFTLQALPIFQTSAEIEQNILLKWACPIINQVQRPDLIGIEIDP